MNARVGDLIAIRFDGKDTSNVGTVFNRYYIAIDPRAGSTPQADLDDDAPQLAFEGGDS